MVIGELSKLLRRLANDDAIIGKVPNLQDDMVTFIRSNIIVVGHLL